MGMDVYGKAPASDAGSYFRRNVWGWHPLWEYVERTHPDITQHVEYGHTNDGDGLDEFYSVELAQRLRSDLEDGTVRDYVVSRDLILAAAPDEPCNICDGTGQRPDGLYGVEWKEPGCNGCNGKGTVRPFDTWYSLDEQDVREFADFLAECGGFAIC